MNDRSQTSGRRYSQRSLETKQVIPNTGRMRRIQKLFWENDTLYSSSTAENTETTTNMESNVLKHTSDRDQNQMASNQVLEDSIKLVQFGRLKLQKVHSSPHMYLVDDFLTKKELNYLYSKILEAEGKRCFERSFVDGDESSLDDETYPSDSMTGNDDMNTSMDLHTVNNDCESIRIPSSSKLTEAPRNKTLKRKRLRRRLNQERTSTFIHFPKMASKNIANIESRTAELICLPHHCIEPIQLVKYTPGQYFNVHHDLGVMTVDESDDICCPESKSILDINAIHVSLPPRPNALSTPRRLVTVLVYLNDLPTTCCSCLSKETNTIKSTCTYAPSVCNYFQVTGGSTFFPSLNHGQGLRIAPKRGQALIWCNITKDGLPDKRLIHAGEAINVRRIDQFHEKLNADVESGNILANDIWHQFRIHPIKYALNIWVCEE
jgi:hypothetical protein